MYTFNFNNCPNLTILYIFQLKKITLLSVFFSEEKKAAQYEFVLITWKNMQTFWKEKIIIKKKKTNGKMYGYLPCYYYFVTIIINISL